MLAAAPITQGIRYITARAEFLPISPQKASIVTVSSAFYWFDRSRFFSEAARILETGGWLIIYDNAFSGQMIGNPKFSSWIKQEYWLRYPYAPTLNGGTPINHIETTAFGFSLEEERYQNEWSFTYSELVDYLLSLSNITWAIENQEVSVEEIARWLRQQLKVFFTQEHHQFLFHGPLYYLHYYTCG